MCESCAPGYVLHFIENGQSEQIRQECWIRNCLDMDESDFETCNACYTPEEINHEHVGTVADDSQIYLLPPDKKHCFESPPNCAQVNNIGECVLCLEGFTYLVDAQGVPACVEPEILHCDLHVVKDNREMEQKCEVCQEGYELSDSHHFCKLKHCDYTTEQGVSYVHPCPKCREDFLLSLQEDSEE